MRDVASVLAPSHEQPRSQSATGAGPETPAEQLVWLVRRYRQAMSAALAAEDYSPVPPAANWLLLAINRRPGTVSDLAARLGVTKQAVSRQADKLVVLGYCDRRRRTSNRREVILRPTAEGTAAAAVLLAAIESVNAAILGRLPTAERDAFRQALATLTRPPPD